MRKLIPKIVNTKRNLFKQYNGDIFKREDLTEEDKTSTFNDGQGALWVYSLNYKNESTTNEVYIYDYILLYDQQGTECIYGDCSYGSSYKNINIPYHSLSDQDRSNSGISDLAMKKFGQLYKYTFRLINGKYEYISTQAIK